MWEINMLQIAHNFRSKTTGHGKMLLRVAAGVAVALLVVGVQVWAFGEAPIRFAPSLFIVALGTWFWGYHVGIASLLTSAVLVNLALLHPRGTWSTHPHALTATATIAQGRMLALAVIPRLEPHDPARAN